MAKILISPSKYLQGAGEMKKIGTYASNCGKKALVLISKGGYKTALQKIHVKWFLIILTENVATVKSTVW